MAYVTLYASAKNFGPEFPGVTNTATITATAMNGYASSCAPFCAYADLVTFSAKATSGLVPSLSPTSCVTNGATCSTSLTLKATTAGNYSVTVFGTYATQDAAANLDTLVGNFTLNVVVYDYSFTVSPTTITFISGSSGVTTIALSSLNHFAGPVTLSTNVIVGGSPPLT